MTKGQLIEFIFLRVTGGSPNSDSNVKWVDIETYLPAIVRYFVTKSIRDSARIERSMGDVGSYIDESFVTCEKLTPECVNGKYSVSLTHGIMNLPGNRGLYRAYIDSCEFIKVKNQSEVEGLDIPSTFFWEKQGKVCFSSLTKPISDIYVEYVADVSSLNEDDAVRLPNGVEVKIVEYAFNHFNGERFNFPDEINSATDEVSNIRSGN